MSFLEQYPSEVLIFEIRPDYSPINADNNLFKKHESQVVRLVNRDNYDLLRYVLSVIDERVIYNFQSELTLQEITSQGKNIVFFFEERLYPDRSIHLQSSWTDTKYFRAFENIKRCKNWCSHTKKCFSAFKLVAAQVTHEGLKAGDWFDEVTLYKGGLKQHADQSNVYMEDWLNHLEDKHHLNNVNCVNLDFINP
mmetsp:Transcript_4509/g.4227  ORF Transcript_4509/g.4227 Transcript_4509/m.4227 type:complete len:195 (-) Transcript_4509:112-696(-)